MTDPTLRTRYSYLDSGPNPYGDIFLLKTSFFLFFFKRMKE